jgi:hypothetical protein
VQVEALADSARALGIPARPLVLKALEGHAKKAEPKDILRVVRQLLADMSKARTALDSAEEDQLVAGAAAIRAGLTESQLARFRAPTRGRSPVTMLTHLSDLIGRLGVPREAATTEFMRLWASGLPDGEVVGLSRRMEQDILNGVNPGLSLANRVRELPGGRQPEED